MSKLSDDELAQLAKLLERLTPEEKQDLLGSIPQIADMPPEKQRALGVAIGKFLHQRGVN